MSPVHQETFFIRKGKQTLPTVELLRGSFSWKLEGYGCSWEQVASVLICMMTFDLKPCEMKHSKPLLCKLWAWTDLNGRFASCYFLSYRNANMLLPSALEEFLIWTFSRFKLTESVLWWQSCHHSCCLRVKMTWAQNESKPMVQFRKHWVLRRGLKQLTLAIWCSVLPLAPRKTIAKVDEMLHGEKKIFWAEFVCSMCLRILRANTVFAMESSSIVSV